MSVNEVRELKTAELEEVAGGVGWVVAGIVLAASAGFGAAMATKGTDFIEEGKKLLEGKQGPITT